MRLSQADLADLLDVSRATVSEATSEGHKCRGYPVRSWAIFDGGGRVAGYDVPSRVVERSNPGVESNGREIAETASEMLAGDVSSSDAAKMLESDEYTSASWADAASDAAPPVSANVGAATVAYRYADVVEENPVLMGDVTDIALALGTGALIAFSTDSDTSNRGLKVAGGTAGAFAVMAFVRHYTKSGSYSDPVRESGRSSLDGGQADTEAVSGTSEQRILPKAAVGGRTRERPKTVTVTGS